MSNSKARRKSRDKSRYGDDADPFAEIISELHAVEYRLGEQAERWREPRLAAAAQVLEAIRIGLGRYEIINVRELVAKAAGLNEDGVNRLFRSLPDVTKAFEHAANQLHDALGTKTKHLRFRPVPGRERKVVPEKGPAAIRLRDELGELLKLNPELSPKQIATQLELLRESTPGAIIVLGDKGTGDQRIAQWEKKIERAIDNGKSNSEEFIEACTIVRPPSRLWEAAGKRATRSGRDV